MIKIAEINASNSPQSTLPWESKPDWFWALITNGATQTSLHFKADSLPAAVQKMRQRWTTWPDNSRLTVRRRDNTEFYKGPLRS